MLPAEFTLVAVAVSGLVGIPLGKVALQTMAIKLFEKSEKRKVEEPLIKNAMLLDPKYREQREKARELFQLDMVNEKKKFRENVPGGQYEEFSLIRDNSFDINEDKIIHGILWLKDADGNVEHEDIYMYQPSVYGKDNVKFGPRIENRSEVVNVNGQNINVTSEYIYGGSPYALQQNGKVYLGYFSKREICSNMSFDFDIRSKFPFEEVCPEEVGKTKEETKDNKHILDFIQIEYDMDKNGNYKVVDLNNKAERERLQAYIEKHKSIDSAAYFESRLNIAESAKQRYLQANRPAYIPPVSSSKPQKVTGAKQVDQDKLYNKLNELVDLKLAEEKYDYNPYAGNGGKFDNDIYRSR